MLLVLLIQELFSVGDLKIRYQIPDIHIKKYIKKCISLYIHIYHIWKHNMWTIYETYIKHLWISMKYKTYVKYIWNINETWMHIYETFVKHIWNTWNTYETNNPNKNMYLYKSNYTSKCLSYLRNIKSTYSTRKRNAHFMHFHILARA